MVDYKIVKFCRRCKKRFVVSKAESKKNYCDDCESIANDEQNKGFK
ncbi:MAG: hypothetical protein ABIC04_02720 [Nanoarchaeota archaeon]